MVRGVASLPNSVSPFMNRILRPTFIIPALIALALPFCMTGCANVGQAQWVRSDEKVPPRSGDYRTTLSTRDLAKMLGFHDDVVNFRPAMQGGGRELSLTYEQVGHPSRQLFSLNLVGTVPLVVASRSEAGGERYWAGMSYDSNRSEFTQTLLRPPHTKYDFRWNTSGLLGPGRYVLRRWTNDQESTNDPGDLRFKARVVLEVNEHAN
jgi:hypothetical protein